jgi:pimeloyl-ACP methyl ester carboxylesterase
MDTLLPGITAQRIPTSRLTAAMLSVTGRTGPAVLFVHGNVSSSLFWQETMLALPERYRPLAIDLRGFGDTDPRPVDATRGLRDYASLYDLAYLGSIGTVPGWPGHQTWPPQPMVAQTRAVLDGYAAAGGRYREVVIDDAGHGPHLDQPEKFLAAPADNLAEVIR